MSAFHKFLAGVCVLVAALAAGPAFALDVYVRGTVVNVRSGPTLDAPVIGQVAQGTPLTFVADDGGGFLRVTLPDGQTGYVATAYLALSPPLARASGGGGGGPVAPPPANLPAVPADEDYTVWLNTKAHIFHNAMCPYYGKTRAGRYMPASQAERFGKACPYCGG